VVLCARCHLDALFMTCRVLLLTSPCVEHCVLVICRGLLATSLFVEGRPLVYLFTIVLGVLPLLQALNLIMYAWWKRRLNSSLLSSSLSSSFLFSSHCSYLFLMEFNPMYSTDHIPKYRSIEKFMKLPFQRVVIDFKRSSYEWVMVISILALRAV
jgi:hypothetical protein